MVNDDYIGEMWKNLGKTFSSELFAVEKGGFHIERKLKKSHVIAWLARLEKVFYCKKLEPAHKPRNLPVT